MFFFKKKKKKKKKKALGRKKKNMGETCETSNDAVNVASAFWFRILVGLILFLPSLAVFCVAVQQLHKSRIHLKAYLRQKWWFCCILRDSSSSTIDPNVSSHNKVHTATSGSITSISATNRNSTTGSSSADRNKSVKISTRIWNVSISFLHCLLSLTDVDTWLFGSKAPCENSDPIFVIRAFLTVCRDSFLVILCVNLATSLIQTHFTVKLKQEMPFYIVVTWRTLQYILILAGILCATIGFIGPLIQNNANSFYVAWMIYIVIRQSVATMASFYFAYMYYFIHLNPNADATNVRPFNCRHPNELEKLVIQISILGTLLFISAIWLIYLTTVDTWNGAKKVSTYMLNESDDTWELVRSTFILILSYLACCIVIGVFIKWVWIKSSGVFMYPKKQSNALSAQMSSRNMLPR